TVTATSTSCTAMRFPLRISRSQPPTMQRSSVPFVPRATSSPHNSIRSVPRRRVHGCLPTSWRCAEVYVMRVIPAIDLKGGRCVRLYQGDFDRETCYSNDPLEVARRFSLMGFDHLHVVDLDGALSGEQRHRDIVSRIVDETPFSLQIGGGIRSRAAVAEWLDAGATSCVIGSLAVKQPQTVVEWLREFGGGRMVLTLDVRTDEDAPPVLATHGCTTTSSDTLWDCVDAYAGSGLK